MLPLHLDVGCAVIMSSSKAMFCDLCVMLLLSFTSVLADIKSPNISVTSTITMGAKGNCTCGGFPTITPDPESSPVLSQSPGLVVNCDLEGQTKCKSLCNALAIATKAKGPEILCNKLKNAEDLKLSAFYKVCDTPWSYADLTAESPLCCNNSKVKECGTAAEQKTAPVAEVKTLGD